MALYKQHGTNPARGCVPMLLTLPVLVAFYAMLAVAIELRGAPFIGWIKDLSAHDPYFVTPVLMGITMFVQQKMSPAVADPVQAKMMMFMPLDVHRHVDVGAERPGAVLDGEQPVGDRPADADQPSDWSAAAAQRASAGGAATQERGGGQVGPGEGAKVMDLHGRVREFLDRRWARWASRSTWPSRIRRTASASNLSGAGGEVLLQRRGEALDALQHIVNTAFRRELDGDRSFVVDCLGYRSGKDAELQQMARFSMEKAKASACRRKSGRSIRTPAGSCTSPSPKIRS